MKNTKVIVFTAIVSVGLTIGGSVFGAFPVNIAPLDILKANNTQNSSLLESKVTPEQQSQLIKQNEENSKILEGLKKSPYYDVSLNKTLLNMLTHIDELENRIAILEAKQNITTKTAVPCLSVTEQLARGYIFNICTGVKIK